VVERKHPQEGILRQVQVMLVPRMLVPVNQTVTFHGIDAPQAVAPRPPRGKKDAPLHPRNGEEGAKMPLRKRLVMHPQEGILNQNLIQIAPDPRDRQFQK
jgi:hypothetical protein